MGRRAKLLRTSITFEKCFNDAPIIILNNYWLFAFAMHKLFLLAHRAEWKLMRAYTWEDQKKSIHTHQEREICKVTTCQTPNIYRRCFVSFFWAFGLRKTNNDTVSVTHRREKKKIHAVECSLLTKTKTNSSYLMFINILTPTTIWVHQQSR